MSTAPERQIWFDSEFVQHHVTRALAYGLDAWVSSMQHSIHGNLLGCPFESPLEMAFYAWWQVLNDERSLSHLVQVELQKEVTCGDQRYRVDFALSDANASVARAAVEYGLCAPLIALELDGHAFHERTKEQVALRDTRDRALQLSQWTVFHVSGSAFHRDPESCVYGVYEDASKVFWDFRWSLTERRNRAEAAAHTQRGSSTREATYGVEAPKE